jgi:hypothetical protein
MEPVAVMFSQGGAFLVALGPLSAVVVGCAVVSVPLPAFMASSVTLAVCPGRSADQKDNRACRYDPFDGFSLHDSPLACLCPVVVWLKPLWDCLVSMTQGDWGMFTLFEKKQ